MWSFPAPATTTAVCEAFATAALLRSQHADWSGNEARAHIVQTADDIDSLNPGHVGKLGSGRIDAEAALTTTPNPSFEAVSHAADGQTGGDIKTGTPVSLAVTLRNQWLDASSVSATLSTTNGDVSITKATADWGAVSALQSVTNAADPFQISVTAGKYGLNIPFTLSVLADGAGSTATFIATTESASVTVGGSITSDTTWTNDRTYIANNVIVNAGVTLTIQPGTVVKFNEDRAMVVKGTLIADGTPESPIRFTSAEENPAPGDWGADYGGSIGGIIFAQESQPAQFDSNGDYLSGSIVRHAIIEYGKGLVIRGDTTPFIDHNLIHNNQEVAVNHYAIMGIATQPLLITNNRIVGNEGEALVVDYGSAIVRQNLIANNKGGGLRLAGNHPITATWNTITGNGGDWCGAGSGGGETSVCLSGSGLSLEFTGNNIYANDAPYDLAVDSSDPISVTQNYWGTTDDATIQARIRDGADDFNLGMVTYRPFLNTPSPHAPPILHQISMSPASPVGIQTVTFDVTFSRPMDQSVDPDAVFYTSRRGTCDQYTSANSGLPNDQVSAVAADSSGAVWFGTEQGAARFDGSNWTVYNSSNSGLLDNNVRDIAEGRGGNMWFVAGPVTRFDGSSWTVYDGWSPDSWSSNCIAVAADGTVWVGGSYYGVARFDGSDWTVYNSSNSGLPADYVGAIATGGGSVVWFVTEKGVARFDGSNWTVYNTSNSGLPTNNYVAAIAVEADGTAWFGTYGSGIASFDGTTWTTYDFTDIGWMMMGAESIAIDDDGVKWFAASGSVARFDDSTWTTYSLGDLGCSAGSTVRNMDIDSNGSKWLATDSLGVAVLYGGDDHSVIANATWLDDTHWRATYDVTSLVPRDDYTIQVSTAQATDGMEIPADTRFGFTVDYAGSISDQTPPYPPSIWASGKEGDASYVDASWSAFDPDSPITLYRYAIGSAAGATDIVDWTNTSDSSMTRSGLGLVKDQQYWVAVQARNVGGLWSTSGVWPFIAGQKSYRKIYIPVIMRH